MKKTISAAVALGGGIINGVLGADTEGMSSMTEQYREALGRINGWENRARNGGKFTEQEAKFIQGGNDSFEKLRGAISQSPRTKKAKLKGAIVGAAMGALPGGLGVLASNMEIKRLEKEVERLTNEVARSTNMLNNQSFISKAPAAKVEAEKAKLEEYTKGLNEVKKLLEDLKKAQND